MIIGIGADLLQINHIRRDMNGETASFFSAVYTKNEHSEAERRSDPALYYATRFAGKEAVYKCFGQAAGEIRWNEIEILSAANGKPDVSLSGACRELSQTLGIRKIHLSLSYDGEYALAYAVAED